MAQRPTMNDVAAAAGVSQAVVSIVLSGSYAGRASETTAQRVRDAAADLDYRPNLQAKSLKTGVAEIIGLVGDEVATAPFSGMLIKGAQDRAWQDDHMLMTIDTGGDDALESAAIGTMLSHRVRGVIYTAMYHREVEIPAAALSTRAVCLNARERDNRVPSVTPDEVTGGYEATKVLLDAGHTRIAMINIHDVLPAGRGRREGYERALREAGIDPVPDLVYRGEGVQRSGFEASRHLMSLDEPPTAIFCGNDRSALGAYQALAELGLRIPEDVSIVGFDDQDLLRDFFHPPLTTVRLPFAEMGDRAAALVLDADAPAEAHLIHCPVIHRQSVAPPKGR
ncbi:LacI family DNA-binding transcriptional regulator [Brachybacterium sp. J144]|uniref:LacI family DNA-binding transcriptional regulator n=1 Tax=Brachybacterium sp. J144 TaxID=3116487 RepID=UPI002E769597|nr:LacI family DNA-binding transcriptional regulator [Brachybacterium sp. J144]MEE1651415.1 LacI family DNA-binding transcriptional regulator [Brachybacterium sp. J144]